MRSEECRDLRSAIIIRNAECGIIGTCGRQIKNWKWKVESFGARKCAIKEIVKVTRSLSSLSASADREGDHSSLGEFIWCVYFGWCFNLCNRVRAEWWWVATLPLYFVDECNNKFLKVESWKFRGAEMRHKRNCKSNAKPIMFGSKASPTFRIPHSALQIPHS